MNNPLDLKNKSIVITGASSGIGKQCAIRCSEQGARIILLGRDESRLLETYNQLSGYGHSFIPFDLLEFDHYSDLIKKIFKDNGSIAGLIHSAGIESSIPLNTLKVGVYEKSYMINTIAFFELVKYLSKNNIRSEKTSYVAISSVMGVKAEKCKLAYNASKAALINGVRSLSLELAHKNIRVNSVSPGLIRTKMSEQLLDSMNEENRIQIIKEYPLGIGDPDDVAYACIYLLSDVAKWTTGTNLIIDGGNCAK